jgi:hypothetical protein
MNVFRNWTRKNVPTRIPESHSGQSNDRLDMKPPSGIEYNTSVENYNSFTFPSQVKNTDQLKLDIILSWVGFQDFKTNRKSNPNLSKVIHDGWLESLKGLKIGDIFAAKYSVVPGFENSPIVAFIGEVEDIPEQGIAVGKQFNLDSLVNNNASLYGEFEINEVTKKITKLTPNRIKVGGADLTGIIVLGNIHGYVDGGARNNPRKVRKSRKSKKKSKRRSFRRRARRR